MADTLILVPAGSLTLTGLAPLVFQAAKFAGRDVKLEWDVDQPADLPADPVITDWQDPHFRDFRIRVYDVTGASVVATYYRKDPAFVYTYEMNLEDGGPRRPLRFDVSIRDVFGDHGAATAFNLMNEAPAAPANLEITGGVDKMAIKFDRPTDLDWVGAKVWLSTSSGFAPANVTPIDIRRTNSFTITRPTSARTTYYVRVAAYDVYSELVGDLNLSAETAVTVGVNAQSIDDLDFQLGIDATMNQGDGIGRRVVQALLTLAVRDGDTVTFDPVFDAIPRVLFLPNGMTFDPNGLSATAEHISVFNALNLSASGFTASLKLTELSGTPTGRSDFLTTGATFDYEAHKGQAAEAVDDRYTFQYDVTIEKEGDSPLTGKVKAYTNDGGGWVLRGTKYYQAESGGGTVTWNNETITATVDGLGQHAGKEFAVDFDLTGGSSINGDNVSYETASAPSSVSATPAGAPDGIVLVLSNESGGIS